MIGYHCTTKKRLERYYATGGILPPVRFWAFESSARDWMKKTQRDILLKIVASNAYPLPDHRPRGHAYWSPNIITEFVRIIE